MICKGCGTELSEFLGTKFCLNCCEIRGVNKELKLHNEDNESKHKWLCKELNSTYVSKNRDYGNSFTKTFDEFGYTMSAVRLQDKLERFKRLISSTTQEVKDESIRDTLMDLANYSLMTVMELDKNER